MILRKLELKDISGILEWMKDPEINSYFRFNPDLINRETVAEFIEKSQVDEINKHYAVVTENDEYLGTISLKNIDYQNSNAEYAVSFRSAAIGKGVSRIATDTLLYIAFFELALHKVYLNVISDNIRAIKFYEKYGFKYEGEFVEYLNIRGEYKNLKWYGILRNQFAERFENETEMAKLRLKYAEDYIRGISEK